jgi:hypothetical protein
MDLRALAFVTLALAVILGSSLPALLVVRHRALRNRSVATGGPPLSEAESATLRAWARRMLLSFVGGMAFIALACIGLVVMALGTTKSAPVWVYWLGLLVTVVVVAVGIGVQFSARCPRCGYNIGLQSRLLLPAGCERCQTRFR